MEERECRTSDAVAASNANGSTAQPAFAAVVRAALQDYFAKLGGSLPTDLHSLVIAEVEKPLIELVLQLSDNQSQAARALGLSRGTLRKKMTVYHIT